MGEFIGNREQLTVNREQLTINWEMLIGLGVEKVRGFENC